VEAFSAALTEALSAVKEGALSKASKPLIQPEGAAPIKTETSNTLRELRSIPVSAHITAIALLASVELRS